MSGENNIHIIKVCNIIILTFILQQSSVCCARFMKIKKFISLLFSHFFIFYLIPLKKRGYVTCAGKSDGLGAQTQAIYSAMLYSHVNGIPYCHTPLKIIAHNYDNNESFNQQAEYFLGFSLGEENIATLKDECTIINLDDIGFKTVTQLVKYIFTSGNKFIFQKSHYHNFTDKIAPKYSLIKEALQQKYYTHPKANPFSSGQKKLHIAYHIRRGDVDINDALRFTGNLQIYDRLLQLSTILNQQDIHFEIKIYSQGNPEDFGDLSSIAQLHLNGNVFDDFNCMIKSDMLFMAKSSFSYCAALLSDGIVIYEPFWHQPLTEWFICNDNHFTEAFKDAVLRAYRLK